jgi:ribosomal-protein-alanine N-acetyltransferase
VRLQPYSAVVASELPAAPGWPHAETADALAFAQHGAPTWLIVDDDGRIAGECGIKGEPGPDGHVEIGYGLAGPSRGKGLGTRAVEQLLAMLRRRGDVRVVIAEVAADNLASRRLVERLGFAVDRIEGEYVYYRRALETGADSPG